MSLASRLLETFGTPDRAFVGVAIPFSVGVVVTGLELLAQRRQLWHNEGLLAWSAIRLGPAGRVPAGLRGALDASARLHLLDLLLGIRVLAAGMLFVAVTAGGDPAAPLLLIALTHLAINWRLTPVLDGSDKMAGLVAFALAIAAVCKEDRVICSAALYFLTAHLALSYALSGRAKALAGCWWSGEALRQLIGTAYFGTPGGRRLTLRWPVITRVASWAVIVFELTFWLALFAPPAVAVVYLGVGILFHAGIGWVMGLNSFMYFFVAAYPAACYTREALRAGVFG